MIPLNSLLNPDAWDDPSWTFYLTELKIDPTKKELFRKKWEYVQTLYGLDKLGYIKEENTALDVGAGKSPVMYYLTNKLRKVVAIDLYDWNPEGMHVTSSMQDMTKNPAKYAPFRYRDDHLDVRNMDGRNLDFDDNTFDIVYSIGSIEHFGGHEGSKKSMVEISRVLKPGGIASITTECVLNEIPHKQFFTPQELEEFLIKPSKLQLVEPIQFEIPSLIPYIKNPLEHRYCNQQIFPRMVILHKKGTIWTSITFFLKKIL